MSNEDKDRVPGETGAHASASGPRAVIAEGGPRPGVLTVRLWSAGGKRQDCRWSKSSGPLLGLVLDTMRASGGVTGAESAEFVAASFADVVTGLQCARRIHWAVEGLNEYEAFRGAAAAILVNAGEAGQRLAAASAQDWEGVQQGKIVLHGGACEALEAVPGISLRAPTVAGWREWVWKSAEGNAGFAADEQALLGMLRAAGRSDPAAGLAAAEDPAGAPTRVFRGAAAMGAARQPEFAGADAERPGAGKFLKMPIVAGAVAAVLIAVALIFFLTRKSPVQSAAPNTPAAGQETHPAQGAAPPGQTPAAAQNQPAHASAPSAPPKHSKLSDMLNKLKPGGDQKAAAPAPVVASHCDLTEEDIQRSLARADRYMDNGDLADARAAYQHVQGCASAHDRAQAGLERIRKMEALNGKPN